MDKLIRANFCEGEDLSPIEAIAGKNMNRRTNKVTTSLALNQKLEVISKITLCLILMNT